MIQIKRKSAGGGVVVPKSKTITRNASNFITIIEEDGGLITTMTRDANNFVTSWTNTVNTWTPTRDANNFITEIAVT